MSLTTINKGLEINDTNPILHQMKADISKEYNDLKSAQKSAQNVDQGKLQE